MLHDEYNLRKLLYQFIRGLLQNDPNYPEKYFTSQQDEGCLVRPLN